MTLLRSQDKSAPHVHGFCCSIVSGIVLITSGKMVWNRPHGMLVIPAMAGVVLSLVFL